MSVRYKPQLLQSDPFQPLAALKRKRRIANSLYGGRDIGQPNRTGLVGAQQPVQRIGGRQEMGGGSSITTGPEQTPPEEQGLLGGILQAKGAYEGVKEAATGGKNIRNYVSGLGDNDSVIAMRNMFSDTYIPNSADYGAVSDSLIGPSRSAVHQAGGPVSGAPVSGLNANPLPSATLPQNHALQGLAGQQSTQIANQVGQLEKLQAAEAAKITNNLSSGAGLGNDVRSGITGALPPTELTKAGQVKAQAVTGLKSPPTTQGVDKLGVAGAGLGVGLNAYDISQNGLNFGNATGLAGSATLLALGASNPVGWALLGASAVDSIFDIF